MNIFVCWLMCTVIVADDTLVQFTNEHDKAILTFTNMKQAEMQTIWAKDVLEQFNDEQNNDELVAHEERIVDMFAYEQLSVFKNTQDTLVNNEVQI